MEDIAQPASPRLSGTSTPCFGASKPGVRSATSFEVKHGAYTILVSPRSSLLGPKGTSGLTPLCNDPVHIMHHPSSIGTLEIAVLSFICRHYTFPIEHPHISAETEIFRIAGRHIKVHGNYGSSSLNFASSSCAALLLAQLPH